MVTTKRSASAPASRFNTAFFVRAPAPFCLLGLGPLLLLLLLLKLLLLGLVRVTPFLGRDDIFGGVDSDGGVFSPTITFSVTRLFDRDQVHK